MLGNFLRRLISSPLAPAPGGETQYAALLQESAQLFTEGEVEAARHLVEQCIAQRPRSAGTRLRLAAMLPAIVQSTEEIASARARLLGDLAELSEARHEPMRDPPAEVGVLPFYLAYQGSECRELLQAFYRACARFYRPDDGPVRKPGRRAGRLRVGFVSTFFYAHSASRITFGLVSDLPRQHFEVIVFSIAPRPDAWSKAFLDHSDAHCVLPLDLEATRAAIRAAELDVLVFTDIGMHPLTYFLAFSRLAPVQLTTWGHPVTSGIDTVDYYLSSPALETPGAEGRYSEQLLKIPGYFMPRFQKAEIGRRKERAELGLPDGKHLYCCAQSLYKLHPDFDPALRAILEGDPQGELVLLESTPAMASRMRRRLRGALGAAAERVRLVPPLGQHDFQQLLAACDVIVDPFHFGGCNSSCEALALGVPVITLPGTWLAGRFTAGLYHEMEMEDCIVATPEAYVARALELGTDPDRRRAVSEKILARNDRLFQRPDAAYALGDALLRIVE